MSSNGVCQAKGGGGGLGKYEALTRGKTFNNDCSWPLSLSETPSKTTLISHLQSDISASVGVFLVHRDTHHELIARQFYGRVCLMYSLFCEGD